MNADSATQLLERWRNGDADAERALWNLLHPRLRALAGKKLRQSSQFTLRATQVANDVVMQLRENNAANAASSGELMSLAARMTRFLIVDHIRHSMTAKRGAQYELVAMDIASEMPSDNAQAARAEDWLALENAIIALELQEPKAARLVELRYFVGMSVSETAATMEVSVSSAERLWRFARASLSSKLGENPLSP
jgi:RNA polymerase sigma factor (TIGR02999 family)